MNVETFMLEDTKSISIDYNSIILGRVQRLGKKLLDVQEEQTDFYISTEKRLDSLEETSAEISERVSKLEGRNSTLNQGVILSLQCGRLLEDLRYLKGLEDIREQLQYSTLVLGELDKMFAACGEKTERFHRQLILKLRSAIKLNCDKDLFTEKQLDMLEELVGELRIRDLEKKQVLAALDRLMDADLSPFPSLEDEDEAFSGHNDSN